MDKFFTTLQKGQSAQAPDGGNKDDSTEADKSKQLPKGVVLGKDGKPCRSCMSVRDWMALAKAESAKDSGAPSSSAASSPLQSAASPYTFSSATSTYPADCPPDVDTLGNHTWTFLHSLTASYPERAAPAQQAEMRSFLGLFARLYPCWVCAEDFQVWMKDEGNMPRVEGRKDFGTWMCEAHNAVNRKLGKDEFDCKKWEERWRDGWRDGRCA